MDEQIEAVRRMQTYIHEHLYDTITPADLAKASLYSPWHAHRLFTRHLGHSPADYIRRLRLTQSALKLRDQNLRIADVAFEVGFQSVDGYQRAFLREFGCNPGEYAASPVPLYLFHPYQVATASERKEKTMDSVKTVFVQTVERPARKALIKRGVKATGYFEYCQEVGCDVWGLLQSIPSLCGEPVCLWLPQAMRKPGTSEYVQGVEVPEDYAGVVPEGFDLISLPAAQYLMFQGEPFEEKDYQQAIGQLQSAIDKYNPAHIGRAWDTVSPRIQLEPIGSRGYIELLPIR